MDGGLKGAALEDVRAHVAGCERCQTLLGAMGRTRAAVPAAEPQRASRRWLAWAVPLTAAAAAIAIWIAIPQQRSVPAPTAAPTSSTEVAAPPPATIPETARSQTAPAPAAKAERSDDIAQLAPDAAITESVPAPLAPPPPAEQRGVVGGQLQQRAAAAARDELAFCGPPPPPEAAGQLTASSASGGVCWVVGRRGLVFRSSDGRTWQRINFPEMTDLSTVRATDARDATVTTIDGRSFGTTDGGASWMAR
jgi:hypothetical protein